MALRLNFNHDDASPGQYRPAAVKLLPPKKIVAHTTTHHGVTTLIATNYLNRVFIVILGAYI